MKLCKDCKHLGHIGPYDMCRSPDAAKDPVTGNAFATFERQAIGNCKSEGRLFEQRIGFFKRIFG
jgi:hypothetical protein